MKTLLVISALLLAGCAHQDLKAPCATLAATDTVPCHTREPVQLVAQAVSFDD